MVTRFVQLYASSESFREGLKHIWDLIKSIGEGLWDGLMKGLEPAKQAIIDLGSQILNLVPESWRQPLLTFFTKTLPEALGLLDLDFGDLAITLAGIGLMFVPGGQIVGAALLGFEAITVLIRGLGLLTDDQITAIKNAFKTAFEWIGKFVGGIISGVVTYITTALSGAINFVQGVFTGNWRQAFQGIYDMGHAAFKGLATFINTAFGWDITQAIQNGVNSAVRIFSWFMDWVSGLARSGFGGIASFIDSIFSWDIAQSIKNALNSVVGMFNSLVGWLNDRLHISFSGISVMGKQIVPAFSTQLASIPNIPYLADGGVLTGPRLVMAGEYSGASHNPEIVTPQNIMRETMVDANTEMVVAIVSAIQALQRTVEEKDQNVYITEGDVGRAAVAYGQQQRRRTGRNPFTTTT